jgi:hypothetical protein
MWKENRFIPKGHMSKIEKISAALQIKPAA